MNGKKKVRGGLTTPPLPPNTLQPPSKCTATHTVAPVRYPPPPTEPKYYEGLPEPVEMAPSQKEEGNGKDFCDQLAEQLEKLSLEDSELDKVCAKERDQEELSKLEKYKKKLEDEVFSTSVEEKLIRHHSEREIAQREHVKHEMVRAKTMAAPSSSSMEAQAAPKYKRSSSLKFQKTPPDQKHQSQKKKVKFADVFGMDLVDVRTFLAGIPAIPQSAFSDLQVELPRKDSKRELRYFFKNPCLEPWFWKRVFEQKVLLERVFIGKDLSVRGVIRVENLSFNKSLTIRYTFDQWRHIHETSATYLAGSTDGRTDQFNFLLWGNFLQENGTLIFCIRYQTSGREFWDNNFGNNYKLQCYLIKPWQHHRESCEASAEQEAQAESLYQCYKQFDTDTPTDQWTHKFF